MSFTFTEATAAIHSAGYKELRRTSKVVEYESPKMQRILYLRINQGFPLQADVMLHPDTDTSKLLASEKVETNKRTPLRFSDHENAFPARASPRGNLRPCGKALHVYTSAALRDLCASYDK